jgi:hypothetical protein
MTIDQAVKMLEMLNESTILDPLPYQKEATKLGIEALKAVVRLRGLLGFQANAKLPGETE